MDSAYRSAPAYRTHDGDFLIVYDRAAGKSNRYTVLARRWVGPDERWHVVGRELRLSEAEAVIAEDRAKKGGGG